MLRLAILLLLFFFNDTATTEIYTLSLHDALPIYSASMGLLSGQDIFTVDSMQAKIEAQVRGIGCGFLPHFMADVYVQADRKSTRLNSSHQIISYAVFCLKKKKNNKTTKTENA